jgi:hypothetical protein
MLQQLRLGYIMSDTVPDEQPLHVSRVRVSRATDTESHVWLSACTMEAPISRIPAHLTYTPAADQTSLSLLN